MTWAASALLWLGVLALLVGAVWAAYRRPPRVTLDRSVPPNGFQGARLPLRVHVTLRSVLPVRYVLEDPPPRSVVADQAVTFAGAAVGQGEFTHETAVLLNRRGEYDWPDATLHWADPFGLFWRSVRLPVRTHLTVFPGSHGLILPDLLRPLLSEGTPTRRMGLDDPISLRGAREYQPGDPPGRVHWRLSARTGTLTVRELERMAASSVTVYVDTTHGSDVYVDSAARLASSLLRTAAEAGLPVSAASNAGITPSGTAADAQHAALAHLGGLTPRDEPPVIPPTRGGGNLIILTHRPTPDLIRQAMLARATASRVSIVAIPEGFYLEPGENPRRQHVGLPDSIRELERQASALAGTGVLVFILRGNQSVLQLGAA